MQKVMSILFGILLLLVPLILWPFTSEVFEFNKMVFVYATTSLIMAAWLIRCIIERKIIFRRTILDIPLLVFLCSQLISTIFSIDPRTSILGYYSRFNGGLMSTICYLLLYWAFVSNLSRKQTLYTIYYLLTSTALVAVYGILEHFGIDKNVWVQDVQNRVFSTLGQPNWLAAFLVALIPLTWTSIIKKPYSYLLSALFFTTILLTKSRSGILGFIIADLVFWGFAFLKQKKEFLKEFAIHNLLFLVLFFVIGSPFASTQPRTTPQGPSLETGGTESGTIRKIVWRGAWEVWKHYPIFGTGPETFAFSYYQFRPVEHNLVSEWDFIYNKAHNEYLNLIANTGTLGLIGYLLLVGSSAFLLVKKERFELLAGYIGLLVSNFFGFSVVSTQLQLFLFPAFAIAFAVQSTEYKVPSKKIDNQQKILLFFVLCTISYVLWRIATYWYADTLYAKAKNLNKSDNPEEALPLITKSTKLSPNEPYYHLELSDTYTKLSLPDEAIAESQKAIDLSPSNVNLRRAQFSMYIRLSLIDPKYLLPAVKVLEEAINMAPTDAKLFYNLGLAYVRVGQFDQAVTTMQKAIDLKPNYKEARLAHALFLIEKRDYAKAKEELNYILEKIDPADSLTKQTLEEIK